jgi:serine/threonine-protein kinase
MIPSEAPKLSRGKVADPHFFDSAAPASRASDEAAPHSSTEAGEGGDLRHFQQARSHFLQERRKVTAQQDTLCDDLVPSFFDKGQVYHLLLRDEFHAKQTGEVLDVEFEAGYWRGGQAEVWQGRFPGLGGELVARIRSAAGSSLLCEEHMQRVSAAPSDSTAGGGATAKCHQDQVQVAQQGQQGPVAEAGLASSEGELSEASAASALLSLATVPMTPASMLAPCTAAAAGSSIICTSLAAVADGSTTSAQQPSCAGAASTSTAQLYIDISDPPRKDQLQAVLGGSPFALKVALSYLQALDEDEVEKIEEEQPQQRHSPATGSGYEADCEDSIRSGRWGSAAGHVGAGRGRKKAEGSLAGGGREAAWKESIYDSFHNEFEVLDQLKKVPQVVKGYAFGLLEVRDSGDNVLHQLPCIVLEWMEGSLDDLLQSEAKRTGKKGLRRDLLQQVLKGVTAALAAAHQEHIIHGDLSLRNVLLNFPASGVVDAKVGGWAMAKSTWDEAIVEIRGTPGYMAPEMLKSIEAGPKIDTHSLGCIAFAAWTGTDAPEGLTAADAGQVGIDEPLLQAFIMRCLEEDPAKRPSCSELLADRCLLCRVAGWVPG